MEVDTAKTLLLAPGSQPSNFHRRSEGRFTWPDARQKVVKSRPTTDASATEPVWTGKQNQRRQSPGHVRLHSILGHAQPIC